jgi:hypothetical protein
MIGRTVSRAVPRRAKIEPMSGSPDRGLAEKVEEVGRATNQARRSSLVRVPRRIVRKFQSDIVVESADAKPGGIPLVPLSIAKTLNDALSAVAAAIA